MSSTATLPRRARGRLDPLRRTASFDLLALPVLGRFLRWRFSRVTLQIPVLLVSLLMIGQAFWGSPLAPKNLATLLTWVHFRGLVVLVMLVAGNLFCMACPFMLPRSIARRWFSPRWAWPRRLRNKWPAIACFVLVLWAYELFDLWSHPGWTGVLIVAYFAAATLTDALFRGASFCKYVCPVGQFNFLGSELSPFEVAVRDRGICAECQTKECIRGVRGSSESLVPTGPTGRPQPLPVLQQGCELALFQPRKIGNFDCTFCLDCVYACPHDNVGILARLPGEHLAVSGTRSGLGKIERRFDFTVLTSVFTFGALLNAFAMISPVYALENWLVGVTGLRVEWPILAGIFMVALVFEPVFLMGAAAALTRRLALCGDSMLTIANRFSRSLIPIGFGVWLAHYGFHFLTGFLTVVPVSQYTVARLFARPVLGDPQWQLGGLSEAIVFPMEVGFLLLGLLGSWMVGWSIAAEYSPARRGFCFVPWGLLHLLLFLAALWIMTQPMDMRGTFLGG